MLQISIISSQRQVYISPRSYRVVKMACSLCSELLQSSPCKFRTCPNPEYLHLIIHGMPFLPAMVEPERDLCIMAPFEIEKY